MLANALKIVNIIFQNINRNHYDFNHLLLEGQVERKMAEKMNPVSARRRMEKLNRKTQQRAKKVLKSKNK